MNRAVNLREELIRQDKWTPEERTNYQREIALMIKTPLTPVTTALTVTGGILGLAAGTALGLLFIQESVPTLTSIGLGVMSMGGFSMAVYCASILLNGGRSRIRHGLWLAIHMASLSTLFLAMALVKTSVAVSPDSGPQVIAVAAILQWILFGVLPIVLWKSQMRILEQRQEELMAQIEAQRSSFKV